MKDNSKPEQVFSLRGHSKPVTCLGSVVLENRDYLISSDASGLIIIWDIHTKRPYKQWQAHSDTILSVRQIEEELILSQSRDGTLKIWKVNNNSSVPLEVFLLPINPLNFCNVEYIKGNLITPATVDSNNFDIYRLKYDDNLEFSFTRIVTNFSAFALFNKTKKIEEIRRDNELGRNDFGIIMKMLLVGESKLFLGFESGEVIGLQIDLNSHIDDNESSKTIELGNNSSSSSKLSGLFNARPKAFNKTIINKDPPIKLIYANSFHTPNPIISMAHVNNSLITGSSNKKIAIHDYSNYSFDNTLIDDVIISKLHHHGIQSIIVDDAIENSFLIGYWNGLIEGMVLNQKIMQPKFEIKRDLPRVSISESTISGQESENPMKESIKLTYLASIQTSPPNTEGKRSYKSLLQTRRNYIGKLLFAAYEDGTIVAYR
ncbi:G-protein beta subunit-like protein containing WD repeats [Scheffersomyces amazonensis]|uniref:G-protein beta subunit-like protein containing WD repeats n=1 Tax=Scheffersomyces amazonensis TaxID=1078765 RepID=UPI00315CAC04